MVETPFAGQGTGAYQRCYRVTLQFHPIDKYPKVGGWHPGYTSAWRGYTKRVTQAGLSCWRCYRVTLQFRSAAHFGAGRNPWASFTHHTHHAVNTHNY